MQNENLWQAWQENLNMFSGDFMLQRNQPPQQERADLTNNLKELNHLHLDTVV